MDVKEIPTLLILGAIPTLLIYFSLFFPDVKLTRKVNTVLHWVQLVLIVILMLP
jgi:hypothetical protein